MVWTAAALALPTLGIFFCFALGTRSAALCYIAANWPWRRQPAQGIYAACCLLAIRVNVFATARIRVCMWLGFVASLKIKFQQMGAGVRHANT